MKLEPKINDLKEVAIPIVFSPFFLFLNIELMLLNHKSELGEPVITIYFALYLTELSFQDVLFYVTKHSLSEMVNKPSSECIKWLWSKD